MDIDILLSWGAVYKKLTKNETIFNEGEIPKFYYQIVKGKVKMCNLTDDGKKFIQGEFTDGASFGEAPLLINAPYPVCAIASEDTLIIKLGKETFLKLIEENNKIIMSFLQTFARRIYTKTIQSKNLTILNPENRIVSFLKEFKRQYNFKNDKVAIPYTRQEIADFTGLRVETVIRSTKKLSLNNTLEIRKHKIYF